MRNSRFFTLIFTGFSAFLPATSRGAGDQLQFETSLSKALRRAGSENKLIFVEFWREGCTWCRKFEETLKDPQVVNQLSDLVLVKAKNTDHSREIRQFEVTGYPTLMLLDSQGKMLQSNPGYLPPERFVPWCSSIMGYYQRILTLKKKVQRNPEDFQALLTLGKLYSGDGRWEEARRYLGEITRLDSEGISRESAEAYLEIGLTWRRMRKYKSAMNYFPRARANILGRIKRLEGQKEGEASGNPSRKDFLKQEHEVLDRILYELGKTLIMLGKRADAVKILEEYDSSLHAPDARRHSWVLYQLGLSQKKLGNLEAARQAFQRCDELYPRSMEARDSRKELVRLR